MNVSGSFLGTAPKTPYPKTRFLRDFVALQANSPDFQPHLASKAEISGVTDGAGEKAWNEIYTSLPTQKETGFLNS